MKFITVLAVLSLALVTACGKNSSGNGNGDRVSGMSNLEVNRPASYQGKCRGLKAEGVKLYQSSEFNITLTNTAQASFKLFTKVFYDKNCSMPLYATSIHGDGTMTMNDTILKSDINRALLRPLQREVATAFNQERLCGRNNWRAFVENDITHTGCIEGSRSGDIHLNSSNNGSELTIYLCDEYQPIEKCEKMKFNRRF